MGKEQESLTKPSLEILNTDEEKIRRVLGILNIPTKEDLKEIEERLDILIKKAKKKGE